jgi:hypothetical protein
MVDPPPVLYCDIPGPIMARSTPVARGKDAPVRLHLQGRCRPVVSELPYPKPFWLHIQRICSQPTRRPIRCADRSRLAATADPLSHCAAICSNYLHYLDFLPKRSANNSAKTAAEQQANSDLIATNSGDISAT